MAIWSTEIKDLEKLHNSFKGQHPKLDKELEKLVKTDDENIVLVYARRCLEVIITDLCERELNRSRGTEPLKGIIDKLNREGKVPENIITSMQSLNSMSTFGAHPKDFDPRQVKPVVLDLTTIIDWYLKYAENLVTIEVKPETVKEERKGPVGYRKKPSKLLKKIIVIFGILLVCAAIVVVLIVFDIIEVGKQARAKSTESVLILPFGNYTGDETLEPLISGMHSSLISEVGRLSGLRVISKTSSDAFKNAGMTVHEIAAKMNVTAVIEPSIMCWGDTICMGLTMISGDQKEEIMWNGDYREDKSKLFNMYNQVTKQIADKVNIKLTENEERFLAEYRTVDPEALDAYMKGRYYLDQISPESLPAAIESFKKAIKIEPYWAPAYAGLSEVGSYKKQMGIGSESDNIILVYENLNKALELDPNSVDSHYTKAITAAWTEFNWEKAEEEFLKAIELNPSHVRSHSFYAHVLTILRRTDEALHHGKISQELDPENPFTLGLYAVVLTNAGECQAALTTIDKALSVESDHSFANSQLYFIYECLGDYEKVFEIWKSWNYPLWEKYDVAELFEKVFRERGWIAVTEEAIRINEEVWAKDGHLIPASQAEKYFTVGKYDKAMDYYEIVYANNNHDPNLPYISAKPVYDKMKGNPRYIALLKKMNLPVR
jgi:adenylate cyclase